MVTKASDSDSRWLWISNSHNMQQTHRAIVEAATSDACVLITGENGTGKGVVAEHLHMVSPRRAKPFVTVDTTVFPKELLEAELFGVIPKFIPGVVGKDGLVQAAAKGTIFFDEIGDMVAELQPKLLRFVQHRLFRRVGATKDESIDARFIFATNRNLEDALKEGRFRQDLFYRIRDIRIRLPPLRERAEDIVPLARHFCAQKAQRLGRALPQFTAELERVLQCYDWPGNVRELEACIGDLVHRCRAADSIGVELLPDDLRKAAAIPRATPSCASIAPTGEPLLRLGPPMPSDPLYERVPRTAMAHRVLTQQLNNRRVTALLQTYRGGGRTFARQIAPMSDLPDLWLIDGACEHRPPDQFYRTLTRHNDVRDQKTFEEWLREQVRRAGSPLIVHTEPRGPEAQLEEVAGTIRGLLSDDSKVQFLIIGGERLLRLRRHEHYSWLRLLPPGSLFDMSDLTVEEVARLLRGRGLPEQRAEFLHFHTGGHPWLLYELVNKGITEPEAALSEVKYQLRASRKLERHRTDPQATEVICQLLRGEAVAPLGDPSVRRDPERYAESRLYFDGLLTVNRHGQSQFRCLAVRLLFESDGAH